MADVSDYVASLDDPERATVARVIDRARRLVPDAEEARSYGMPALRHRGARSSRSRPGASTSRSTPSPRPSSRPGRAS